MHVLEYHATMAHVSTKVHRIDVNVNEVMKGLYVIDWSIHAPILFVIMEVPVMHKIISQCVNVHLDIEERIAMKRMVCDEQIIEHGSGKKSFFASNEKNFFACEIVFVSPIL